MADLRYPVRSAELIERYRAEGAWRPGSIGSKLTAVTARFPDRRAVVDVDSSITYRDLDRRSTAVASGLLRRGLRPGDAAIVQSGNVVETVVVLYGLLKAGVVPVCSLPQHREREIDDLIRLTGARAHVVQVDWARADLPALAESMRERHDEMELTIAVRGSVEGAVALEDLVREPADALPDLDPEGLAILQLSGGTTGTPKLIPRLHCDQQCNSRSWAEWLGWDEHVVSMHVLPVMHNAGLALSVIPAHLVGGTVVLAPRVDGEVMAELIERERVTDMLINATVAFRMLESPEMRAADLSSLVRVIVGPQNPDYARRMETELGIRALGVFGMGEGLIMCTPWDAPADARYTTVGTPIHPLDEVRLVDSDLNEVPFGELGELTCRGPYTIVGYYAADEHNAAAVTPDGFFRTGDLARAHSVDGQTFYSIEGRIKDNIDRGGEKVNAEELERLLITHPGVAEIAVVGMPDPEMGERVCAYVVPRPGAQPDVSSFADFLREAGVAKFKWPERVEITSEFPLTTVRKVSKKALRDDISSKLASERQESGVPV